MADCLVLGANGFIGSHLVDALTARGHRVRAFVRFSASQSFSNHENLEVIKGEYLNRGDLEDAVKGMDYVFHFISTTTPVTAENDPLVDIDTNIRMSVELLRICSEAGVKKVIYASTGGAIYGDTKKLAHKETDIALPVSPYAIGKLTVEHYLRYFRVKYNLDSVVFRISNPYGTRQPLHRKQGVIPVFVENVCQGLPLTVYGDGSMIRDYIYVEDVAHMIASTFDMSSKHDTYNLGAGTGTSISELVDMVALATNTVPAVNHMPVPPTFVDHVVLDTQRFMDEFDITPTTDLYDGIVKTVEYVKDELEKEKHEQH